MKSWIGHLVFSPLLCVGSTKPPDSKLPPWRGDLKSGGLRLGSTPKIQPSKHLKLEKMEGESK